MKPAPLTKTVAIIYGFNEGPHMAHRLISALREAGYSITADKTNADVIIAHSGGCFLLHPGPGQHIIMIGLPYWPNRSMFTSICRKVMGDLRVHHREGELKFWAGKTFWNLVYFWNMSANFSMLKGKTREAHWRYKHVTVVRNGHDPMCTPNLAELPFTTKPTFVELPGHHDDLWLKPTAIVRLVQTAAPLAAKQ